MSTQGPASTSTTSMPSWVSDYAQNFLNAGAQTAQRPYQQYQGPRVADLSPLQQQALQGFQGAGSAMAPLYGSAMPTLQNIVSGNQNPYNQQVVDRTTRQVTDAYNQAVAGTSGRFNSPGNWDSARHDMRDELNQRALATGLGDAIGGINASEFDNSQNRALQGVGALNSVVNTGMGALTNQLAAGQVPQQNLQQVYNTGYNDFMQQQNYPWQQLQNFGGLLGSMTGAVPHTTTQQQGYDPVSQGMGLYQLGSTAGNKGSSGGSKGGSGSQGLPTGLDYSGGPAYG